MTHTIKLLSVGLISMCLAGCSVRVADLTLVSTKNIDLSDVKLDAKRGQRHKAEDCKISLLGIPFGLPNMETAVDKALEAGGGNVMIDEVTESKGVWFLIGSQHCISVEGTVLKIPEKQAKAGK